MPLFIDYTYNGSFPAPNNWTKQQPKLSKTTPAPTPPAKYNLKSEDVHAMSVSAADFYWHAATMGYGEAAQYIVKWTLSSGVLTPNDVADLKRLTRTRAQTIFRACQLSLVVGGALHITPRPIYSLIDPTEKGVISYYIGSAMASLCGPAAVSMRNAVGSPSIKFLFHTKILAAHAVFGQAITVQARPKVTSSGAISKSGKSIPDFIGLDDTNAPHIFEAKGDSSGGLYQQLADGLDQCERVISITFPLPSPPIVVPAVSLNVCAAFLSKTGVKSNLGAVAESIRCAVVSIPTTANPVVVAVPRNKKKATGAAAAPMVPPSIIQQLVGTQLLGLYGHLKGCNKTEIVDNWTAYHFTEEEGFEAHVTVAAPTTLVTQLEQTFEIIAKDWQTCKSANALKRKLNKRSKAEPDIDFRDHLVRIVEMLGGFAINQSNWQSLDAPQTYKRLIGDPWLCIRS